jgi:hypothetical protein
MIELFGLTIIKLLFTKIIPSFCITKQIYRADLKIISIICNTYQS